MGRKLVYNGNLISAAEPVLKTNNRAFLYGDGLFESFRVFKGMPMFIQEHWARLTMGLKQLKIEAPESFNVQRIQFHLKELIRENGLENGVSARLSVFRNPGGKYAPLDYGMSYTLEVENTPNPFFELNKQGKSIDVFSTIPKHQTILSSFKMIGAYPSVLGGIEAKEKGVDDVLLVNGNNEIIESTSGNLFWVKEGKVYTPPIHCGPVAGIARMHIINFCLLAGIPCFELVPTPEILLQSDEVFLSNSVQGVQWVNRFQDKRYFNKFSKYFIDQFNETMINSWKDLQDN